MNVPVIAFFNNKGGVGKTTLVYHLAWMFADIGLRVVAADLDPQANLTAAFLDAEKLEVLWNQNKTIFGSVQPLDEGTGDIAPPHLENVGSSLVVIPGDLRLSAFEDSLSEVWPKCGDGDKRSFRVVSSFSRSIQAGAKAHNGQLVLLDVGPNLGALNRAALIAADFVVIPLAPDLFSLQGLRNLGPTVRRWRNEWKTRLAVSPFASGELELPSGKIEPVGYVILQHAERLDRPVKAYQSWLNRIPLEFRESVLGEPSSETNVKTENDPYQLAKLKQYQSLMPMAQEARKPIFHLKSADGAIGSHFHAVQKVRQDFKKLAEIIAARTNLPLPPVSF